MPIEPRVDEGSSIANRTNLLGRLDARIKLLAALGFVVFVLLNRTGEWHAIIIQFACVALAYAASGMTFRYLARRLLVFWPMVALLAIGIPLSRGLAEGWEQAAAVFIRSTFCFIAVVLAVATTAPADLRTALLRLGVPPLLVAVLALALRYIEVLREELERMRRAKLSRTFRSSRRLDWKILPNFIGLLFVRSMERAERVHQAMLARGWTGQPRSLEPK